MRRSRPSNGSGTRDRILETAWDLAKQGRLDEMSLGEVASASGVSRQTLYSHFRNRSGLIIGMTIAHDDRTGFMEQSAALLALEDPVEATERFIRAWCEYIPRINPVARWLAAGELLEDDTAAAWRERMEQLRTGLRILAGRLGNRDLLVGGIDRDHVADVVWSTCHYTNWWNLVHGRGWDESRFVEYCLDTAFQFLSAPRPANDRGSAPPVPATD